MSDIDLKALRTAADLQRASGRATFRPALAEVGANDVISLLDRLEAAERERDELREAMARQVRAAVSGMNAAKQNAAEMERNAIRLHAESSPAALASERSANAILTEEVEGLRKDGERYAAIKRMLPDLLAAAAQGGVNTDEAPGIFARHCDSSKLDAAVDVYMTKEQERGGAETAPKTILHGVDAGVDGGAEKPAPMSVYGWAVTGLAEPFFGEFAEHDARAEAKRVGGTAEAFPLFRGVAQEGGK